jgi:hypothetical protein
MITAFLCPFIPSHQSLMNPQREGTLEVDVLPEYPSPAGDWNNSILHHEKRCGTKACKADMTEENRNQIHRNPRLVIRNQAGDREAAALISILILTRCPE